MAQELIYTSVPRGLVPGSNGYCTVAMSEGLPTSLRERLEALSNYDRPFHPDDPRNPVAVSHLKVNGKSVLSRVAEAGHDHTDRTNHVAHHVVLDDAERPAAGPAWLAGRRHFFQEAWSGAPRFLSANRGVPAGDDRPCPCRAWAEATGDAGWAGVLVQTFLDSPKQVAAIICDPGTDVLRLFAEAIALLPPARRWDVTFTTYFAGLLPGVTCHWRGVLRDTPVAQELAHRGDILVIDLRQAGRAPDGPFVEAARTGRPATAVSVPTPAASAYDSGDRPARRTGATVVPTASAPANPPPAPDWYATIPELSTTRSDRSGVGSLTVAAVTLIGAACSAVGVWAVMKAYSVGPAVERAEAAEADARRMHDKLGAYESGWMSKDDAKRALETERQRLQVKVDAANDEARRWKEKHDDKAVKLRQALAALVPVAPPALPENPKPPVIEPELKPVPDAPPKAKGPGQGQPMLPRRLNLPNFNAGPVGNVFEFPYDADYVGKEFAIADFSLSLQMPATKSVNVGGTNYFFVRGDSTVRKASVNLRKGAIQFSIPLAEFELLDDQLVVRWTASSTNKTEAQEAIALLKREAKLTIIRNVVVPREAPQKDETAKVAKAKEDEAKDAKAKDAKPSMTVERVKVQECLLN